MTSRVSRCASLRPLVFAVALATAAWSAAPTTAAASDGYEVGLVAGPLVALGAGLYTMFIITTATGAIYQDSGWAGAQLAFSLATMVGAGIGIGYTLDGFEGGEGLAGAMGMLGGLSVTLMSYAIDALVNPDYDVPDVQYGFAPLQRDGELTGGMLTLSFTD
ncbi:MAG: hypothetical protein AB8I08_31105 [Sandaracinaceae bacterium]